MFLYRLPKKLPDEKIIEVIRKDFFIFFKKILLFIVIIGLPLAFGFIMMFIYPALTTGSISYPLLILSVSAYYLFAWLFFFFSFIDYYLDIWIITNERIIDIKQNGFFSRTIAEQRLNRIQDVTSEVRGFFSTILKFGNVHIQTAGEVNRFLFEQIPNPDQVRDKVIKLAEQSKMKHKDKAV